MLAFLGGWMEGGGEVLSCSTGGVFEGFVCRIDLTRGLPWGQGEGDVHLLAWLKRSMVVVCQIHLLSLVTDGSSQQMSGMRFEPTDDKPLGYEGCQSTLF